MRWNEELPNKSGKYIVQTKSIPLGIIRTLDAELKIEDNKHKWSFRNQIFYRYLSDE